ncbi:hypothetical protein [Dapis sp. BLCC M172]|uniref:hypothetical protein n=1 Tax=Dapis sp. BLCC M172 TaxID=2975281 RepID=UPI003CEAB093
MSETADFDLVIKNVQVVRPNHNSTPRLDLGIKNGKFAHIAPEINPELANDIMSIGIGACKSWEHIYRHIKFFLLLKLLPPC